MKRIINYLVNGLIAPTDQLNSIIDFFQNKTDRIQCNTMFVIKNEFEYMYKSSDCKE